ncbi:uncharacterized protein [Epargyreus clarus]|uniref:uncharacterized protein n=1 Tax=Epargyreus clarus TaxID=520877 RepID=UPI003C2F7734
MTIILYDYYELEERASRHLKAWKAWHLVMYAFAGVFGILNYIFLQNAMQLVDNNCVLYPRELAFRTIDLPNATHSLNESDSDTTKRETTNDATQKNETGVIDVPEDMSGDDNNRLILDTSRTLFGLDSDCQFAEYMPIMSTIFAAAWATMFSMCPGGGHPRSGLQQPWRILAPALLCALVLVGLTGHSFNRTNGGLHAFCSAFYNVTNSTTCSAASPYLQQSWGSWWGLGGRAAAARAASAAVWGSWAAAAALFLARCLAAPDFQLRRTRACLKDPQQKLTPYLKKHRRSKQSPVSPSKQDTISVKSEPTLTTELVTASIEHEQDTAPPSLQVTPIRKGFKPDDIELKTTPPRD